MADPNDDKTVLGSTQARAPALHPDESNILPIGTRLGEFEIVGLVGIGGFGIVYLAQDHSLGRRVALKEYMPSSLAARGQGLQVSIKSQRHVDTFEAGRRSFVNEARLLAQFDHPALVKVYRFWEDNGTAYMVMPYYEGFTLKHALQQMSGPPDEAWLKRLLAPLLDALDVIHAVNVFHRDIAPDNIMLLAGERPLLLDFGAARHVISGMTQALTVILKPGYAPIEQYAEMPELKQGAWTDIYALAAVVHFAIMGRTPPPAVGRMMNDSMLPLAQEAAGRYSDAFLRAIDRGLAVRPQDRPQSVAEFRTLLGLDHASPISTPSPTPKRPSPPIAAQPGLKWSWLLVGAAGIAVMAGGVYYLIQQRAPIPPAPEAVPMAEDSSPSPPSDTATGAAPERQAAVVEPPLQPLSFNPLDEIDRIFQQRDRDHSVTVALEKAQVRIGRDRLTFRLRSSKSGYLYVLMVGTDGQHFYKLFPNAIDSANQVEAGKTIALPRAGWVMVAGGPAGANQFVAVVSEYPRDFDNTGLVTIGPFAEFPFEDAAKLAAGHRGPHSPFLGTPVCAEGSVGCSSAYGAAVFTIVEVE